MQPRPYLRSIKLKTDSIESCDGYPFSVPVIKNFSQLDFHADVTFLIGENGSGKSTLIEAIAVLMGYNAEGGNKNFRFSSQATHSSFHNCLLPVKSYKTPKDGFFLRAETFYNAVTYIDEIGAGSAYGDTSLHAKSHGESFWALLQNKFKGNGLYILDEPEAALSPTRQMAMLSRMHQLVKQQSQFIIATHSPILLAYPSAKILEINNGYLCDRLYEETEHFQVAKGFLTSYKKHLDILLGEEE